MTFKARFTSDFENDIKFLKKDKNLAVRVENKILEILENPEHYRPLKNVLKGKRRVHIGPYVILYEIENDIVIFHSFMHHDNAYK